MTELKDSRPEAILAELATTTIDLDRSRMTGEDLRSAMATPPALYVGAEEVKRHTAISYYIDEVQFCDKTIFDLIIYIAQNQNCGFVAAGLDLDFKTCRFGLTFDLLNFMNSWTLDHEVYFLKAVCKMCGSPACFTGRIASSSELILIGGDELYNPVCQNHFSSRTHIE